MIVKQDLTPSAGGLSKALQSFLGPSTAFDYTCLEIHLTSILSPTTEGEGSCRHRDYTVIPKPSTASCDQHTNP